MSVEQQAAEILERAADGFESGRYGWVKGVTRTPVNPRTGLESYCATGALHYEAGLRVMHRIDQPEYLAAVEVYRTADTKLAEVAEARDVPNWNDYIATSVSEVIEKMKEAAKNLRNEGGVK